MSDASGHHAGSFGGKILAGKEEGRKAESGKAVLLNFKAGFNLSGYSSMFEGGLRLDRDNYSFQTNDQSPGKGHKLLILCQFVLLIKGNLCRQHRGVESIMAEFSTSLDNKNLYNYTRKRTLPLHN